ncbi:putative peroxygenase 3, partial [Tetrabaena socialis]
MTVLQQHCGFWDRDNDGRIYPLDTYRGCREIGMSVLLSGAFMWLLHFTLLVPFMTQDSWVLHPYLCIYLKNIHRLKHASDTGTFDEQGRMYPGKFEQIWDVLGADQIRSYADVRRLVWANKDIADPFGWWVLGRSLRVVLAADERRACARNSNYRDITRGLKLDPAGRMDVLTAFHHVVWMGDLNYSRWADVSRVRQP